MLLLTWASAQVATAGELSQVTVRQESSAVRVEILLTAPSRASVETAQKPDRLIVVLPTTRSDARQQRIAVGKNGIRDVRYGLHGADPVLTHVVVDLDRALPYVLSIEGNKVVLTLELDNPRAKRVVPPAAGAAVALSADWLSGAGLALRLNIPDTPE